MTESPASPRPEMSESRTSPLRIMWHDLLHGWARARLELDQAGVIEKIHGDTMFTGRYVFMNAMSAGIAILGLLLSSPAVVIGAMLISPLMGPLMGAGFALAIGDLPWLRQCGITLIGGIVVAVLFTALIVLVSPLQTVTDEIASRTRPNLFDLAVALFSALAGAYAMIRGREGAIVGVAIATALMPPLAVVGFGLATGNATVFGGALLLFFTNLMTITLSAAVMARIYGFSTRLSPRQSWLQTIAIIVLFVALAVPLGWSLRQIAWESNTTRTATAIVKDAFARDARLSQLEMNYDSDPIRLNASVLTPTFLPDADRLVARRLREQVGQDVDVHVSQYRVGTAPGDADAAALASARAREQQLASERQITALADRIALVAGVEPDAVLIDRSSRRAVVKAAPLPDASLATWRALEQRIAATEKGWTVEIRPPAAALPTLDLGAEELGAADAQALELAAWAARRVDAPLGVTGPTAAAERAITLLRARGVDAVRQPGSGSGPVRLRWLAPDAAMDATAP